MIIAKGVYPCPVHNCQGRPTTKCGMCRHFAYMHLQDLVTLPGKGLYPKCERCGMQVNPTAWNHQETYTCDRMQAVTLQRKVVSNSAKALNVKFYAYGKGLKWVEVFKYLGRLIAQDDVDTQVPRCNLRKAWGIWAP